MYARTIRIVTWQCIRVNQSIFQTIRAVHTKRNHYDTFNLKPNCTAKDIRDAFIKLSEESNPDVNQGGDAKQNTENFRNIVEAYKVLSKPESRVIYDSTINQETRAMNSPFSQHYNPYSQQNTYSQRNPYSQYDPYAEYNNPHSHPSDRNHSASGAYNSRQSYQNQSSSGGYYRPSHGGPFERPSKRIAVDKLLLIFMAFMLLASMLQSMARRDRFSMEARQYRFSMEGGRMDPFTRGQIYRRDDPSFIRRDDPSD